MLNKSNLFTNAHKAAKEIKAENVELTYRDCFSVALKEAYKADGSDLMEMADWFATKNGFAGRAFDRKQIVAETEKAIKVRTAKYWGNTRIIKEAWIPKSVCTPCTDIEFIGANGDTRSKLPLFHAFIVDTMMEDCFEMSKKYMRAIAREFC